MDTLQTNDKEQKQLSRKEKLELWKELKKSQESSSASATTSTVLMKQGPKKTSTPVTTSTNINVSQNKENLVKKGQADKSIVSKLQEKTLQQAQGPGQQKQQPQPDKVGIEDFNNLKSKYRNLQKLHRQKMEYLDSMEKNLSTLSDELHEKSGTFIVLTTTCLNSVGAIKAVKKSMEELQKKVSVVSMENDELREQVEDLKANSEVKEVLIRDFSINYVQKSEYEALVDELKYYKQEEEENVEIINALRVELENAIIQMAETEQIKSQVTELKSKLFDHDMIRQKMQDFENANLGLAIKLEEAMRDLCWKDQEIDLLKATLKETISDETETSDLKQVAEIECQTVGDFDQTLRETQFLINEFNNMKAGNDLMYQQMLQVQQRANKDCATLKQELNTMKSERDEYMNLFHHTSEECLKLNEMMLAMECELDSQKKKNEYVNYQKLKEELMSEIFEQAEKMMMKEMQQLIEKNSDLEQKLRNSSCPEYSSHEGLKDCVVEFENEKDASLALHLTGTELADRRISIIRKDALTVPEDPESKRYLNMIYVGNLHPSTNAEDLKRFFIACGRPEDIRIKRSDAGVSAIIEFISQVGVNSALQLNSRFLLDNSLYISRVDKEEKPIDPPPPKDEEKSVRGGSVYSARSRESGSRRYRDEHRSRTRSPRRRSRSRDRRYRDQSPYDRHHRRERSRSRESRRSYDRKYR